ncbi:MAG: virulence RhuM family protein, partial [Candidatus Saccharimonadales bacterium]
MSDELENAEQSDFLFYNGPDSSLRIEVFYADETVWLTQERMAALFNKAKSTISEHIQNVYNEGELEKAATMRKFGNTELSATKPTYYYNLDIIISVGYRVKSLEGTWFRQWATKRLQEYIIKGFAMNDQRLKQGGAGARYFTELLQRVRDIRSSERNLYQRVTDIY